jgi:acyl carrier protein
MQRILDRLTVILRDMFDDDSLVASPSLGAGDVGGWDSLAHVRLMIKVQREFKVSFAAGEISALKNVGDLAALVERKTASG